MNIRSWMLIFSLLSFLTSCQVKESAGTNEFVAGHVPATNSFSIQNIQAGTYVTGDVVSVTLSFPYEVTVAGGTPSVTLTIGATARSATYISGSGTKNLLFQYTIVAADNDADGIAISTLNANGATLTFLNNGVVTNCSTTITARTFSNVLVDNTAPTITNFEIITAPGFYNVGAQIVFRVTYNEPVIVTGSPRFSLTLSGTGTTGFATYSGGSGTRYLNFTYTVLATDADTNGYGITSPIALNTGTIKDNANNDASLDFAGFVAAVQTATNNRPFDGRVPYVVMVTTPASGTYSIGQTLDFILEFNREVNVTGNPYLVLNLGTNGSTTSRIVPYLSKSGNNLTFRYTIAPGDNDTDGIQLSNAITVNGGGITGAVGGAQSFFLTVGAFTNNLLPLPSTASILIDAVQPTPTAVSRNADTTNRVFPTVITDNTWIIGQQLLVNVTFNTPVTVNQTLGVPRIPLTIGAVTRYATYLSTGSGGTVLVFTYTIQEGDLDNDGSIGLGNIDLNEGTITDANNTNATLTLPVANLTSTFIDGVRPTISSVTAPANGTYSTITGNNHVEMSFTLTWSEAVNYSSTAAGGVYFVMDIGGTNVNANYFSGNNTTSLVHRAASLAGRNDLDGITLTSPLSLGASVTVKDQAGNTATTLTYNPPDTSSILVDTTTPLVSSITPPADSTYTSGQNLDFTVNFNESVNVNKSGGYPRIPITIGATVRYLEPVSNGSGLSHVFRYTIQPNELDTNGVALGTTIAHLGTGYARDNGWNNATTAFVPPNTTGILVDSVPPTVTGYTAPANGTYTSGNTLSFTVTYSENVTVSGAPRIQVTAQTGTLNFDYVGGSGGQTLTFSYTITANDFDFNGLGSVGTIDLNTGTITDSVGQNAATAFGPANLAGVNIAYPNTKVWVTNTFTNLAPAGSGVTTSSAGVVTNEACGAGTCRIFNGDDSLILSNPVNGVQTVFIVFKTSGVVGNYPILPNDIDLVDDTTAYDLDADGTIKLNGVDYFGAGTHDTNLASGSTNILWIDFTSSQNLNGTIIPDTFLGAIGEVIIIDGALDNTQKTHIYNYLDLKY